MHAPASTVNAAYLDQTAAVLTKVKETSYVLMNATPLSRILDVGCGPGIDTHAMASMTSGMVVGVDYCPEMVRQANARGRDLETRPRPVYAVANAARLPFDDHTFDAVRCERLLQHVAVPEAVVRELTRLVRPKGRLVLVDTDFGSLSMDYAGHPGLERRLQLAIAELTTTNGYSGRQLFRWLKRQGLEDISISVTPVVVTSYALARNLIRLPVAESCALKADVLCSQDVEELRAAFARSDNKGEFFASINLVTVAGTVRG